MAAADRRRRRTPARPGRPPRRPPRRGLLRRSLPLLAFLLVVGLVAAEVRLGVGRDWLADQLAAPDPLTEPAQVPPPEGLTLPELATPAPVAAAGSLAAVPAPARVRRALAPLLADPDLGRHVVVEVGGLTGDGPAYTAGSGLVTPASTTKLLTSIAALAALGPDRVFTTRVVAGRGNRVVLVGGGDPFLASRPAEDSELVYPVRADLVGLAGATATALAAEGRSRVRVAYDDSLFTGPVASPRWEADYLPDQVVAPVSALWVDGGRPSWGYGRVDDPASYAAQVFATALREAGVEVTGPPTVGRSPGTAPELAAVDSAPLAEIVEHVLDVSDNEAAEVLAHQVGLAVTGEGSFAGGRRGVASTLAGLGVDIGDRVYDGSGLSRGSRVAVGTLLDVLRVAASPEHPELRTVVTGLPVAGFTGSLETRFEGAGAAGRGEVRAKTGTLTGVSGLAGVVTDAGGAPLVFAMVADRVRPEPLAGLAARDALDAMAAALAACDCARP
ncbi:MAG: D-alanyl-D-alanine carboxypeptidase/D-alanyl-D-alanine-endopeptidase [Nocardioides sp.]